MYYNSRQYFTANLGSYK